MEAIDISKDIRETEKLSTIAGIFGVIGLIAWGYVIHELYDLGILEGMYPSLFGSS